MTVLIDSSSWIEYFKGSSAGKKVKEFLDSDEIIVFSVINLVEVYRWFLSHRTKEEAEEVRHFMKERGFLIPLGEEHGIEAAKLKVEKKLGLADAIVLATAQVHHAKVVTGDNDFVGEDNVIVIRM